MPNSEKISAVAEITEHFTNSAAAVITEYRGLTVKQVSELRRSLGRDTTYAVVKNTLTKRAAANAGVAIDDSLLVGPTAIAFVTGDPVAAAKGLRDFAKINPLLIIKGGVLDGKTLSPAEINRIADLESREVLLAKLARAIKALPTRAASLFQAPLRPPLPKQCSANRPLSTPRRPRHQPRPPIRPRHQPIRWRHQPRPPRRSRHQPIRSRPQQHLKPPPSRRSNTHPNAGSSGDTHHREKEAPWRSSVPTSCSTRSRK